MTFIQRHICMGRIWDWARIGFGLSRIWTTRTHKQLHTTHGYPFRSSGGCIHAQADSDRQTCSTRCVVVCARDDACDQWALEWAQETCAIR
jgi:hypothetical protein